MLRGLRLPAMVFMATAVAGLGMATVVYRQEALRAEMTLQRQLLDVTDRVGARMTQIETVLISTRSYLGTRPASDLTRARFAGYVDGLIRSGVMSGVHGLGLAQVVPPGGADAMAARLAEDYGTRRGLWPPPAPGVPRTAITLLEPADARNRAALGYDMSSEPLRRQAMVTAIATGRPTLSAPVILAQEITRDQQTGALLYHYMDHGTTGGLTGFVYAPLRMGRLFETLARETETPLALRVVDAAAPEPVLYAAPEFDRLEGAPVAEAVLAVAGREWRFSARDPHRPGLIRRAPLTLVIGGGALVLAVALAIAVQGVATSIRQSQALAVEQRRRLASKDLHLLEMSHRLKNVLTRVLAMTRQAARRAGTPAELLCALEGRLQAMAEAQNLLVRSADQGADLRALIEAELAQIFGAGGDLPRLDGPAVALAAEQVQPLGLTVHELATNALKHGTGALPGDGLRIRWQVREGDLRLVWDEAGTPPVEPATPGFGTRLIDSCVRLELAGRIERRFHPGGLTVTLTIPLQRPGTRPRPHP